MDLKDIENFSLYQFDSTSILVVASTARRK